MNYFLNLSVDLKYMDEDNWLIKAQKLAERLKEASGGLEHEINYSSPFDLDIIWDHFINANKLINELGQLLEEAENER